MCKQGRDDDIEVKVNIQKPYPNIFFTLQLTCALVWKTRRKGALYVELHFHIICSYLVCILLGVQSLHLLMFFFFDPACFMVYEWMCSQHENVEITAEGCIQS